MLVRRLVVAQMGAFYMQMGACDARGGATSSLHHWVLSVSLDFYTVWGERSDPRLTGIAPTPNGFGTTRYYWQRAVPNHQSSALQSFPRFLKLPLLTV